MSANIVKLRSRGWSADEGAFVVGAAARVFRPVWAPADSVRIDRAVVGELKAIEGTRRRLAQALDRLVGKRIRPSCLRDRIMVTAVIEWAAGNVRNMGFYCSACEGLASNFGIRTEIYYLVDLKLLVVRVHPDDGRVTEIAPTQKLVDFLAIELRDLGSALPLARPGGLH
jgi:hypothetical protein